MNLLKIFTNIQYKLKYTSSLIILEILRKVIITKVQLIQIISIVLEGANKKGNKLHKRNLNQNCDIKILKISLLSIIYKVKMKGTNINHS